MKANELQINNFLQTPTVQFVIPVYQRNYDWTTHQCGDLLNDIISVEQDNRGTHFIGSIVFIHEGTYSTSEVKELVIIDGQQRLTTINILYVALYRFAKEKNMSQQAEMLYNMFLTNQYVQHESSKLKLKQTDNNAIAFKAILNGTENELDKYSNVKENYSYFKTQITEENFTTILNGLKRLIFVEISLERDKDDPQRIFESLNSTGLDLSQSDLIRNFILMDLEPKDQNKIYDQIWNPIEENARDLVRQKSMVSDYIRDYLTLKTKRIPNKGKVYDEFKKLYINKKDDSFHQELETIKALSVHYRKFINPQVITDSILRRELEYISRLEINVAYPFLLQVFEDCENGVIDQPTLIKILKLIQSFTWRRFIVGLPTAALNKIFMTLYSEIDHEDYFESLCVALLKKRGSGKFPNDQELRSALHDKDLYNTQSKNRSYFFELLENHNNREYVNTASELITIEHIFPRNPDNKWLNDLSTAEFNEFKEFKLNTIANLTLSGNNGALSNLPFINKRDMNTDGKEQGYAFSRLWLNDYLKKQDCWNIEKYNDRFKIIYDRFLQIWQFPNVTLPVIETDSEQNIFDAEPPTNKKLEYFIFEDTKVEESVVAQMYFYVLRELYEKNPELLIENNHIIKVTKNQSDFRMPQELINGYFIESNIDSNSKFSYLKKMLNVFELEDELIIKYNSELAGDGAERFSRRRKFWGELLSELNHPILFQRVSPSKDHWLIAGAGISGLAYTLLITRTYIAIEFTINRASKEDNKRIYSSIESYKSEIETSFGSPLLWDVMNESKMSRIKFQLDNVNFFVDSDLETIKEFFIQNLAPFYDAFNPVVQILKVRK
jgi:uncharacterized protein with ParB-like and HNH nuclease domain